MAHIGHVRLPPQGHALFHLKSFLCVCLIVLSGPVCAARSSAHTMEMRQESPRRLAYAFDYGHAGRVHVSLETSSPESGTEFLCLPSRWGEATELERAIENLKITGSEVSLEPTGRPSRLKLRAKAGTTMRLDYDLVQDWTGPFRASQRHRILVRPELVEFNGENGLVAPRMDGGAAVQVSFRFENLPAGQTIVTSFGTETRQRMSGSWSEVANALFVAGIFSVRRTSVLGGPVLLATAGSHTFSEQELALKTQEILGAERAFWRTPAPAWYAVVLVPFEAGTSGGGGSAFTAALSLSLAPGEHFGAETESLLAHEAFHAWNPDALGTPVDSAKLAWFVEGFTTYYQDLMLERSGLLDRAAYVKRVNAILRDYLISPTTSPSPGVTQGQSLDDDEARSRDPYLRGAVIALWLNAQIVRQTGSRSSLDDLMRALLAEHLQPLTPERIFRTAGRFVDAETVQQLQLFTSEAPPIPLTNILGTCVRFAPRRVWTFALGVPLGELASGALLRHVEPDSAAYRAGLREGDTLLAWSFWYGDPEHEVVLTVRSPEGTGAPVRIRYLPRGGEVTIPQAEVVAGCTDGAASDRERAPDEP